MTDNNMIHFFVPMQRIPSATHQMKKLVVGRDGKPHTYEPPAVKETTLKQGKSGQLSSRICRG